MGAFKGDRMQAPHQTRDTMAILVKRTCEKTQLPESVVLALYQDGWQYLEFNGKLKWVKSAQEE